MQKGINGLISAKKNSDVGEEKGQYSNKKKRVIPEAILISDIPDNISSLKNKIKERTKIM